MKCFPMTDYGIFISSVFVIAGLTDLGLCWWYREWLPITVVSGVLFLGYGLGIAMLDWLTERRRP